MSRSLQLLELDTDQEYESLDVSEALEAGVRILALLYSGLQGQ